MSAIAMSDLSHLRGGFGACSRLAQMSFANRQCDDDLSQADRDSSYISGMAANLPLEFNKYLKNRRHLRASLRETKHSFDEIRRSGYFRPTDEKISNISISPEDEEFLQKVIDQPAGIIVLGQRHWARACIVNELFGQPLLPTSAGFQPSEKRELGWRMVRFTYGLQTQISLALPNSYELVEKLAAYEQPWHTIPWADLELKDEALGDPALLNATLDIRLRHALLRDDVQVVVAPCPNMCSFEHIYQRCIEGLTPVIIYAIAEGMLSEKELSELATLRKIAPKTPVFFICARTASDSELTESEQHARSLQNSGLQWPYLHSYHDSSFALNVPTPRARSESDSHVNSHVSPTSLSLFQQLCGLGFLSMFPKETTQQWQKQPNEFTEVDSELVENFDNFPSVLLFIRHILQSHLVNAATILNEAHNRCLRMFILSAFDMTWDMMITPKRLEYARQRESELYESLMSIANKKQEEIRLLIVATINSMRDEIISKAMTHEFHGVKLPEEGVLPSARELQICATEIQDLVLSLLNSAIAEKLVGSVEYLRESFVGTLERCLTSLESSCKENGDHVHASNALKQILNAAYQVEVTVKTSSSVLRTLWEKMKQLIQSLPWKTPPQIDDEWKRKVAADMLDSLSEWRLAKSICAQFRERLKVSHEQFAASLKQLEALHSGRLERTEEQRIRVRKSYAPRIARYALESTSLRDVILHGMPQLGREIGRGQYGVVYACDSWGGYSPCALKSVVPPDDKHWNDLAMEFFYTRSIPEHDRIVQIRGSVIDRSYGGGTTPAVLLIMERLQKDLYCAIKTGLEWMARLQVALDVVEGIRYLHSQGLVHRDIKLKNVLLDKQNRGKISDLGFCKPEAMMSGSIVGTPIHMAPELFTGRYDSSVDVYAFGILFWYICAGHVRLPYVFEQCQSKDQLWNCVRKGARPERLTVFDDECWSLMEACWATEPSARPLFGDVEPRLMAIMKRYRTSEPPQSRICQKEVSSLPSCSFLNMNYYPG